MITRRGGGRLMSKGKKGRGSREKMEVSGMKRGGVIRGYLPERKGLGER